MEVEDNAFIALRPRSGGWLGCTPPGQNGRIRFGLHEMKPEMSPSLSGIQQWSQSDDSWKLELDQFDRTVLDKDDVSVGTTLNEAAEIWKIFFEAFKK